MIARAVLRAVEFSNALPYAHLGFAHLAAASGARRLARDGDVLSWGIAPWAERLAEEHEAGARRMFAEARKCLGLRRSR